MTRRSALALLLALLLAGCTAAAAPQQPSVSYGAGEGAAAKLAGDLCAACHGENLAGGRSQSLIDDPWVYGGNDAETRGQHPRRPSGHADGPFKGALSEQEIRSLVVLIRELAEKARVEGTKSAARADRLGLQERAPLVQARDRGGGPRHAVGPRLPAGRAGPRLGAARALRILTPGQPLAEPIRGVPQPWVSRTAASWT